MHLDRELLNKAAESDIVDLLARNARAKRKISMFLRDAKHLMDNFVAEEVDAALFDLTADDRNEHSVYPFFVRLKLNQLDELVTSALEAARTGEPYTSLNTLLEKQRAKRNLARQRRNAWRREKRARARQEQQS